jgi:hypothetical protein
MLTGDKVNAFAILKNPMILIGLVSMAVFLGLPYLVDNSKFPLLEGCAVAILGGVGC